MIELNASGQINISCEQFSFHAKQNGEINTDGTLDLNVGSGAQTAPDNQGVKKTIDDSVKAIFSGSDQ